MHPGCVQGQTTGSPSQRGTRHSQWQLPLLQHHLPSAALHARPIVNGVCAHLPLFLFLSPITRSFQKRSRRNLALLRVGKSSMPMPRPVKPCTTDSDGGPSLRITTVTKSHIAAPHPFLTVALEFEQDAVRGVQVFKASKPSQCFRPLARVSAMVSGHFRGRRSEVFQRAYSSRDSLCACPAHDQR